MPHRKIKSLPDDKKKFRIPVDLALVSVFPDQDDLLIQLEEKSVAQFDVFQKDLPAGLKNREFRGKKVRWLNNFGLRKKNSPSYEQTVDAYSIEIKKIADAIYVYFDGNDIQELPIRDGGNDKVTATLNLGDPPVGWVK